MPEHPPNDGRPASGSVADQGELEAPASTVRLDDLFAIVRRHIRLVLVVAAAVVAAAGCVAYVTGSVYRAIAVIRLSDPRRAFTGGVVEDPAVLGGGGDAGPLRLPVEPRKRRPVRGGGDGSRPMGRVLPGKAAAGPPGRVL